MPWYLYGTCTENDAINIKLSKKVTNGNTKNIYAVFSILHYMMTSASDPQKCEKGTKKMLFGNRLV